MKKINESNFKRLLGVWKTTGLIKYKLCVCLKSIAFNKF